MIPTLLLGGAVAVAWWIGYRRGQREHATVVDGALAMLAQQLRAAEKVPEALAVEGFREGQRRFVLEQLGGE